MQNVVVEDETSAKRAISLLKSSGIGRATFLPLTTMRGRELKETGLDQQEGFVGVACDLVETDSRYQGIFRDLLGRIVIADHLDHASKIAKQYQYRFRIVTLDGQQINAGGSYTGGSVSKSVGMLSRANEIRRLTDAEKARQKSLQEVFAKLQEAEREEQKLAYEAEVYLADQRKAEDVLLKTETELSHYQLLLDSLHEAIDNQQEELTGTRAKETEAAREVSRLEEEIREAEEKEQACRAEIESLLQGHSELLERKNALSDQVGQLRLRAASARSEYGEAEKAREELAELNRAMEGDRQAKENLIADYQNQIRETEQEIQAKEAALAEQHTEIDSINQSLSQIAAEKLKLEEERNRKERESKAKNDEILNLERERSRLESKKDSAAQEEQQIADKLWENYELTVLAAQDLRQPLDNVGAAKSRVSELKNERKKLGNVNLGAIEEFERVNERFTFLSDQRGDLEKSKAELLRMIDDLTGEMKTIFAEQFAVINRNFAETFSEIFGGGKAELLLEDPSDILNCGIEIKVQPPGKTLRTITLLSGGERAFVAIALYFAIMKVRPTPFCVLDEIEAALDDVNVSRFAAYLRKLTSTTQFIVITHRRGTMEEADMLYGVTMQEQGVSKMLAISIAEVERELKIKLK